MQTKPQLPPKAPFCYGPFTACKYTSWINGVSPFGGPCHILDMRGWGYLTGGGHLALGLTSEEAIKATRDTAEWVANALNAAVARDNADMYPTPMYATGGAVRPSNEGTQVPQTSEHMFPTKLLRDLKTKRANGEGNMIVHMVMDEAYDEILSLHALKKSNHTARKVKNLVWHPEHGCTAKGLGIEFSMAEGNVGEFSLTHPFTSGVGTKSEIQLLAQMYFESELDSVYDT